MFSEKVAEHYDFKFGKDQPFLPSNATTDTGEFLDPKTFPDAKYCGHCHQEAHKQWRQSAHANSFRAPWYLKNVNLLMATKGNEYARHCEGCHDPDRADGGGDDEGGFAEAAYDDDGITCTVCHSIQKVDRRGTGSYVLAQPAVLVDEAGKPIYGKVRDAEILAHLDRHSEAVMKPFLPDDGFLRGVPQGRAAAGAERLQVAAGDLPVRRVADLFVREAVAAAVLCEGCGLDLPDVPHERGMFATSPEPGAKEGKLASHRWLGANTMMPKFYKYDEQLAKTKAFLQAGVFNVDLFALETRQGFGARSAPLGMTPFTLASGRPGDGVGGDPEQRRGALACAGAARHVRVVGAVHGEGRGRKVVMESGFLKPDGDLDERAHSFTNRLINKEGTLNELHQVWDNRVVAYNNTIQSGRSQLVRYQFRVPEKMTSGALTVTAQVNYRRFDQHFIDFGWPRHTCSRWWRWPRGRGC